MEADLYMMADGDTLPLLNMQLLKDSPGRRMERGRLPLCILPSERPKRL
jgi:hypothetical protein